MSIITGAMRQHVDTKLREAADLVERKSAAKFEAALGVIYECRTLIDKEMDTDVILVHLESAAVALGRLDGGADSDCVRAAIRLIGEAVKALKRA
jgi:hypothetical protein